MSSEQIMRFLPWRIRLWWRDRENRRALRSLAMLAHPHARDVCRAIEKTVAISYSAEESNYIKKIEDLREKCLASSVFIEFTDYGAGEPDNPKSLLESRQGVQQKVALSQLARHTSKSAPWSSLLFNLVKELRPQHCLELGTCIGFSASYQCSAMKLNGAGSLVTLEGAPSLAEVARKHLYDLGVNNFDIIIGRFEDNLEDVLTKYAPFDFMFNDGHHDGQAMLSYFEKCLSSFSDNAVLLFDDIAAYPSMQVAWRELWTHRRVAFVVDFGTMGLIGLGKERENPSQVYQMSL